MCCETIWNFSPCPLSYESLVPNIKGSFLESTEVDRLENLNQKKICAFKKVSFGLNRGEMATLANCEPYLKDKLFEIWTSRGAPIS